MHFISCLSLPSGYKVKEETEQTLTRGDHGLETGLSRDLALIYGRQGDQRTCVFVFVIKKQANVNVYVVLTFYCYSNVYVDI